MPIYPNDASFSWTEDNFGPLYIPKEGATVDLTQEKNRILYKRIITVYEGHSMEVKDDGVYIDGSKTDNYTFEMNYYWMMGDNRHESADSRFWGFVPEDHVVGKAVFIWFSKDPEGGIRWNRIFRSI
jgi:signal peptidase I